MLNRFVFKKTKGQEAEKEEEKAAPPSPQIQEVAQDGASTLVATPAAPVSENPQPKRTGWQVWKPRIILTSAIFLPVFLETLDYTGAYCFALLELYLTPYQSLQPPKPTSHPGSTDSTYNLISVRPMSSARLSFSPSLPRSPTSLDVTGRCISPWSSS
jgi:hypothetical protein